MQHIVNAPARRRLLLGIALAPLAAGPGLRLARAADFPERPITFIVPWPAGGGGDVVVRMLAARIGERLGQQAIVDNRGGATGTIGSALAARSQPDGYTLVYAAVDSHFIFPQLNPKVPYEALRDFTPVAPIGHFQFGLAVRPDLPAHDAQAFLALVKESPRRYTYGTWGVGSAAQVVMEAYKAAHGLDILHVPYQGTAPALTALVGGEIDSAILPMQITDGYVKTGKIRMLGLGAPQRFPALPDLPTLKEQGMDIDFSAPLGFLAPAGLPADIQARLNEAITEVVKEPKVQDALRSMYVLPATMTPQQYQAFQEQEARRWREIVRNAQVTLQ